jgi:hypothetical protein
MRSVAEKAGAQQSLSATDAQILLACSPTLYFGTIKINNNFDVVDEVGKEDAKG